MSDDQKVVLVDETDNQVGIEDKMEAHRNGGKLHRAFSIFVFNSKGQTLLQQRAAKKYHAPKLWANTCCSHPFPGEDIMHAAHRRLGEEMGMDCNMHEAFSFIYKAPVGNGLTEWEFDHVVLGFSDQEPKPNADEVMAYKWVSLEELQEDIKANPDQYVPWLKISFDRLRDAYKKERDSRTAE